ncbi:MAG: hydroxymethylbilane synthase [Candidatus Eisenbacteria bacterium]|nr:hydroxymethylbilane synthase [Candidatus Eisenbacteria bacterium]
MRASRAIKIGIGSSRLDTLNGESIREALARSKPELKTHLVAVPAKKEHKVGYRAKEDTSDLNELEKALVGRRVDVALSSMTDVTPRLPREIQVGAVTTRSTPFDALICLKDRILDDLDSGARVATSSLRVKAQLLHYRSDLDVVWTDVSVETQMKRVASGVFDGVVISAADAESLGWQDRVTEVFTTAVCLPAVGQGSLCLEVRRVEKETLKLVKPLDDAVSRAEINAELSFLNALGGSGLLPCGALGRTNGNELVVEAFVASPDGKCLFKDVETGKLGEEVALGARLARRILEEGGQAIVDALESV